MVQPIDYTLDVINPIQSTMQGFTGGMQLGTAMADRERALAQQRKDQLVKQQMNEDLFNLSQNPTHEGYVQVMTKYPQLSENLKRAYDTMDVGKQRTTLSLASQTYAALNGGNAEIAKQVLEDGALAYENSGSKQDASVLRGYKKMIENNPQAAKTSIGMLLASTNPDKFADIFGKLGDETRANELQPIAVAQGNANVAKTKADTAKTNAETNDIPLAAEDRRTGVENQGQKIEYDNQYNYDKLSQDQQLFYDGLDKTERIEADKLRSSKAESSIQRVERLEKVEGYANAAAQAAESSKTAARLAGLAKDYAGAFSIARRVPGNNFYTFAQDIETLKSQVFLTQIEKMRGLGALTDKEGDAIRSSIASLDISQHPKVVQKNLTTIAQQMAAAAKSANRKAQLYATKGQGYSPAVTQAAKTLGISPAEAQKFVNENGL